MEWIIGTVVFLFLFIKLVKWLTPELYEKYKEEYKKAKENLLKQEFVMPYGKGTYGSKRGRPPKKNKKKNKKK